jgi:diacylglycerol kinase (ATP)
MRASVIFGPGSSERDLHAFRRVQSISWQSKIPAVKDEADVIILFGGDGTIHRHLPQLVALQLPVLIVPRGSGNDFARALNLRNRNDSLSAWRKFISGGSNVKCVDVGTIKCWQTSGSTSEEHFFCTVAGVGIDGEVCRRANELPRWLRGNGGYMLTLLSVLFRFAPFPMKITLDGTEGSEFHPTILAAFANVPAYGGGMKIAPQARMDDGRLDVCVIRDINKFKLFCVFPTIYFGRHLSMAEVEYSQAISIRLETEHPFDVFADGEYVCQTPIEVSLKRSALRVIVPDSHS